ncbi:MAG: squalene synthase HpnD [Alphaproteobacteria bacterium]|nr:MAG: squalene synthase HpnD [Alphaproteobacteria bacterium]
MSDRNDCADARAVAAKVRAAGSSFYWAMRLMEPARRDALFAVYAFCREVDDIADGEAPADDKREALARWRERLSAIYDGRAESTLERALARAVARFDLDRRDFEAVIEGMEMDAGDPIVAPDMDLLDRYCDRVASAVGRLCVRVFGAPRAAGEALSRHLGRALQLTNILRDVEEDAARGRLYLPADLLAARGLAGLPPQEIAHDPRLAAAKRDLATTVAAEFAAARRALAACDSGDLRPAAIMMAVYERRFARMCARDFAPEPRSRLHDLLRKAEKLAIALRLALKGPRWRASM